MVNCQLLMKEYSYMSQPLELVLIGAGQRGATGKQGQCFHQRSHFHIWMPGAARQLRTACRWRRSCDWKPGAGRVAPRLTAGGVMRSDARGGPAVALDLPAGTGCTIAYIRAKAAIPIE